MESNSRQPRRVAWALIGGLVALGLVRAYFELLMRYQSRLLNWFERQPVWILLLIALAIVTSGVAAWLVQRTSLRRLVVPIATVVGALTTAVYTSISGSVAGFVVGLLFAFPPLRRFSWQLTRMIIRCAALLAVAAVAGVLGRSIHYSEMSAVQAGSYAIYALAAMLILVLVFGRARMARRVSSVGTEDAPDRREWFAVWHRFGTIAARLALVGFCLAAGIWLGWQLDVQRRIWRLQQVGGVHGVTWNLAISDPHGVYLNENARDRHLQLLRGLPRVKHLSISSALITDDGCRHLAAMKDLSTLQLLNVPIHDAGFRYVAGLPALQWLFINDVPVTREVFHVLATLPALTGMAIGDIAPKGPGLGGISLPIGLQEVNWSGCGLTDEDLTPLAQLQSVKYLTLRDNQIRGPGLVHVAGSRNIATLNLAGNPLDDRYLSLLSPLTLYGLELNGIRLSDAGVSMIERQPLLEYLAVRESGINDQQLRRIIFATQLRDAELDAARLSHRLMVGWSPRDVTLYLEHQTLDAADIARLAEFDLDVNLVDCEFTPGAIAEFAHHARLFTLIDCRVEERFIGSLRSYVNMPD